MKTTIEAPACPALFAYGTLMLPEVLRAVAGREFPGRPARLAGYARYRLHGKPYPGLRLQPGAATDGVLYGGLDDTAWRLLDRYEDDCYERMPLQVELDGSNSHFGNGAPGSAGILPAQFAHKRCFRREQGRYSAFFPFGRMHRAGSSAYADESGRDARAPRGHLAAADVYVVKPEFYPQLTAEPWSAEAFRRQHLASFLRSRGMEDSNP